MAARTHISFYTKPVRHIFFTNSKEPVLQHLISIWSRTECPLGLEKLENEPFQNLAGIAGKPWVFLLLWLEKLEFYFRAYHN